MHFGDGSPTTSGKLPPTGDPFHVYTGAGAKQAVLFVGDGQNVTNATVSITVEAPPPAAPALQYSDESSIPCTGCGIASASCLGFLMGFSGIDCVFFELPAVAAGRPFVAWTDADFALTFGVWFRENCDPTGDDIDSFGNSPFDLLEDQVRGTVPAGSRCVVLYDGNPMPGGFGPGGSTLAIDIL